MAAAGTQDVTQRSSHEQERPRTVPGSLDTPRPGALIVAAPSARKEIGIALLLFAVSFLYLLLFRRFTTIEPDEGIILQGAQRILHGQVLYRDFFSFFTPGSYYLLALLFKIFGSSMMVARTTLAVYGGVFAAFTFLIARRFAGMKASLVTAGLVTLTCLPFRFLSLHNWDSTLWACAAVYCAVRWLEVMTRQKPEARNQKAEAAFWGFAAGSFASLTALFEQSKGAGLILGLAVGFVLLAVAGNIRLSLRDGLAAAAGLAWPLALTLAYFAAQHALRPMLADWLWPLHHYSLANRVPYGYQSWPEATRAALFGNHSLAHLIPILLVIGPCFIVPVLPLIALGMCLYLSAKLLRGRSLSGRQTNYTLVTSALSGLLLSVVVVRADIIHFMYLAPLFYVVLAWILDGRDVNSRAFHAALPIIRCAVVVLFGCFACALLVRTRAANVNLSTRRGVLTAPAPDTVLQYAQAHVAAGSSIFVYPYLPLYYYLTAAHSPTRFEYLQPGMNTLEQNEEAVREVEADQTRVVLFEPDFNEKISSSWPNTPLQFIARDPVGDYLLAHYHSCKLLHTASGWPFLFMVRDGLSCPR